MAKDSTAVSSVPLIKTPMGAPDNLDLAKIIERQLSGESEETEKAESDETQPVAEVEDEAKEDVLSQEEKAEEQEPAEETEDDESEETEAESEESEDSDTQAEKSPRYQKRIDDLVRKRKEAEEKATQLEARIKELEAKSDTAQSAVPPVAGSNPFSALTSLAEVRDEARKAEDIIRWAIKNQDGAVVKTKDGEAEYTAEQISEIRYNAERALRTDLPEQANYLVSHEQFNRVAEQQFPWWKDKASAEYNDAMQAVREFPEVRKLAGWRVAVGDMIEGRKAREAREKAATEKKPQKVAIKAAPPQPKKSTAAPRQVPKKEADADAAFARVLKFGGNEKDIEKYLLQKNL